MSNNCVSDNDTKHNILQLTGWTMLKVVLCPIEQNCPEILLKDNWENLGCRSMDWKYKIALIKSFNISKHTIYTYKKTLQRKKKSVNL